MFKQLSIVLIALLISSNAFAEWRLKSAESNVYYVSTKNEKISEVNYFNTLSGTISKNGTLTIKINLESVETNIPIRNERVKSMLFEVINYPKATINATINAEKLAKLTVGKSYIEPVNFTLSLHGVTHEFSTRVKVIKRANGEILAGSISPIIISADQFGLQKGLERLRKIARLKSITPTVPVTFNLTFIPAK